MDWLPEITELYEAELTAKHLLTRAVQGARADHFSWQDIANAMGISRQGAAQRFKDLVDA